MQIANNYTCIIRLIKNIYIKKLLLHAEENQNQIKQCYFVPGVNGSNFASIGQTAKWPIMIGLPCCLPPSQLEVILREWIILGISIFEYQLMW